MLTSWLLQVVLAAETVAVEPAAVGVLVVIGLRQELLVAVRVLNLPLV